MNLRQIEILRAFMMTGTVSGAADLLRISQPGVSKALKHIESQLDIQLFRRVRGRLLLKQSSFSRRSPKRGCTLSAWTVSLKT